MAIITTYVCDCCGGQSTNLALFAPPPMGFRLGTWAVIVSNGPFLCNTCLNTMSAAATIALGSLFGTKTGQTITS